MSDALVHPIPEQLTAFALGKLAQAEAAEIAAHLADCDSCQEAVAAVPDDSVVALLRSAPSSAFQNEPTADSWVPVELADHPRYRLLEWLGAGGMGVVYKAEHRLMERRVALKVISKKLTTNPAAVERFQREVKAAAKLSHPNIVTAYDAEQAGDLHFLVMEFIEGTNLARLVEDQGPLSVNLAGDYIRQSALGLQHAYVQGMVHRDIKPQNLMLTPTGQVKILDFELAALAVEPGTTATITDFGQGLGTPDYAAPEQIRDAHAADIRADIYSLGCTLYFLFAGHPPFPDGTVLQKVAGHLERTPKSLATIRPDLPASVVRIVERMMTKEPGERYQTPAEVAEALFDHATQGSSPRAARHPWLAVAANVIAVIVLSMVLFFSKDWTSTSKRAYEDGSTEKPPTPVTSPSLTSGSETATNHKTPSLPSITKPSPQTVPRIVDKAPEQPSEARPLPEVKVVSTLLKGHTKLVTCLSFSPDSKSLASAGADRTIRLWDVSTGANTGTLTSADSVFSCVVFSPNGGTFASGGMSIKLWDAATGRDIATFSSQGLLIESLAFNSDGTKLASGGKDRTGRLWDVASAKSTAILEGRSVAFAPDGKTLALGGHDPAARTILLWDVATGKVMSSRQVTNFVVLALAFSPNSKTLASVGSGIELWDLPSGKITTLKGLYAVAFAPDGKTLATGSNGYAVQLWDVASGQNIPVKITGDDNVFGPAPKENVWSPMSLAFSPNGKFLASSIGNTIRLWRFAEISSLNEQKP